MLRSVSLSEGFEELNGFGVISLEKMILRGADILDRAQVLPRRPEEEQDNGNRE